MSKHKGPTEAGSGGKLGRKSMEHRTYSNEIKKLSNRKRRQDDSKKSVKDSLDL